MVGQIHPSWHFRLPGWSGFWLIIQPSKHDSTLRVYETLDPILIVHFWGVFLMALGLGETSFSQMRLGLKPIFAKKTGLRAPTGSNAGWSHQEIVKTSLWCSESFSGGQKKDRQGSEGLKTTINPPAFGTHIPERAFCVLRFGPAKVSLP